MTTTPAAGPSAPADHKATLRLSRLLRADVLGHRLIDVENARLVRAADLELAKDGDEWVLAGVDTRRRPRRLFGLLAPDNQHDADAGGFRDWHDFEWLIG